MSFNEVAEVACNTLGSLISFLNSNFISAFLASLAGAGSGAWGVQKLAERSLAKKELRDSLRQANAAIAIASTLANNAFALKAQFVRPLFDAYIEGQKTAKIWDNSLRSSIRETQIKPPALDLTKGESPSFSLDTLKNLTHSAPLLSGRALALMVMTEELVVSLAYAMDSRNKKINEFERALHQDYELACAYFGLEDIHGRSDASYSGIMECIRQYLDDLIFSLCELTDELQAHAKRVHIKLQKISSDAPGPHSVDFSKATNAGLIPPREDYEGWLSRFRYPEV